MNTRDWTKEEAEVISMEEYLAKRKKIRDINVLRYIPNNKMAATSARIRFAFFIIIILYNESRL